MDPQFLLLLAVLPIILASAASDLRALIIPNSHVLTALALFLLAAPFLLAWPEILSRLITASITFAAGFVLFILRLFGGGDVKMMPVLLLFVPSTSLVQFLQLFAISLLIVSLGALMLQAAPVAKRLGWESTRMKRHVPVGVAMALSVALLALRTAGLP